MVDQIQVVKLATLNPAGTGVTAGQWNTIRGDVDELLAGRPLVYAGNHADLQAAIDAAAALPTGGTVGLDPSVYVGSESFIWRNGVSLWGMGREASELTIANNVDDAVLKSEDFDTLVGTDSTGGIHGCGLYNLRLNGNAANQTGTGTGAGLVNGLSIYGYDYDIDNVTIFNCADSCFYSEWGTSLDPPGPNGMEARISKLTLHDAGLYPFFFNGPHDSQISDVLAYNIGGAGLFIASKASGSQLARLHHYGDPNYAIYIDAGVCITDLIAEGASLANVFLAADDVMLIGLRAYGAGAAAPVGIEFVESAARYYITGKINDCTSGAFKYTSAGGNGIIIAQCHAGSGVAEVGTPPATDKVIIPTSGGMTGARFSFT